MTYVKLKTGMIFSSAVRAHLPGLAALLVVYAITSVPPKERLDSGIQLDDILSASFEYWFEVERERTSAAEHKRRVLHRAIPIPRRFWVTTNVILPVIPAIRVAKVNLQSNRARSLLKTRDA